jgi:hypothetical protein
MRDNNQTARPGSYVNTMNASTLLIVLVYIATQLQDLDIGDLLPVLEAGAGSLSKHGT